MGYRDRDPLGSPKFGASWSAMTGGERVLFCLAIANFAAFIIGYFVIGGSALSSRSGGGHFYVGDHGRRVEVSFSVFLYSLAHALSLFVTHPLAIVAILRARRRARRQDDIRPI